MFTLIIAMFVIGYVATAHVMGQTSLKKVGGLYHWKAGRIGGSFYCKRRVNKPARKVRKLDLPAAPLVTDIQSDVLVPAHRIALAMRTA